MQMSNKEDFKDFEAMTEKADFFHPRRPPITWCTFQILGGCQGRRTGVGVTTVSNSLILGGWVTKVLKNCDKKWGGGEWWVPSIF